MKLTKTILLFTISSIQTCSAVDIVFEASLLFKPNKFKAGWELGPRALLSYSSTCGRNAETDLPNTFFQLMEGIPLEGVKKIDIRPRYKDQYCPPIMVAWYRNELTSDQSLQLIQSAINATVQDATERLLLERLAKLTFHPEMHVKIMEQNHEGKKLVEKCKNQVSSKTKTQKHRLFLHANVNTAIGEKLRQSFPELFDLFDGMLFSGEVGSCKPSPAMYDALIQKFGLTPDKTYYIDEQPENINTAQNMGIRTIVCENENIKAVEQELRSYGLLK